MAGQSPREVTQGVKEIKIALHPDTEFKSLVDVLEKILTFPHVPGIRGCSPCNSGIDRLVIESSILERIR